MASEVIKDTVDRCANRVQVEVGLGEGDRSVGHGDPCLGLGHGLRPGSDQHGLKLGFRRLLQELGRGHRQLGLEDLLLGNLTPRRQGPQPLRGGFGALECHLRLLDRELVRPPLLAPRQ